MTKHMRLKDTAATYVVYMNNGETDHMVGSFPKSPLGALNAVIAVTNTQRYFQITDLVLDVGVQDAEALRIAIIDANYMMTHARDQRIALSAALVAIIDGTGEPRDPNRVAVVRRLSPERALAARKYLNDRNILVGMEKDGDFSQMIRVMVPVVMTDKQIIDVVQIAIGTAVSHPIEIVAGEAA